MMLDGIQKKAKMLDTIQESNENNNSYEYTVNAVIEQNPMDWTTFKRNSGKQYTISI